jgi:hypothetical protein
MYKTDLKTSDLQESNKMIGGDWRSNVRKGRISDPTPITDELKKLTSVNNVIKTTTEKLKKISSKFDFLYNKTVGLTSYISSDSALSPEKEIERLEQSRQNKGMLIDAAKKSYDAAAAEAAIEKDRKESSRSSSDRNVDDEDEDGFSMSKTTREMILHKLGIVDLTSDSENKDKNIFYTIALPFSEEMSNNIYSNLPNGFTTDVFFSTLFKETKPIDIDIPILQHLFSNGTKSYEKLMLNLKKEGKSSDTARSDKSDSRSPTDTDSDTVSKTMAEVSAALTKKKPQKPEEKEKAINTAIKQSINDKLFKTNPQLDTHIETLISIKDDIKAL